MCGDGSAYKWGLFGETLREKFWATSEYILFLSVNAKFVRFEFREAQNTRRLTIEHHFRIPYFHFKMWKLGWSMIYIYIKSYSSFVIWVVRSYTALEFPLSLVSFELSTS